ncbi:MAG: hypothetical protein ACOX60_04695 [Massiliimalia sp.]|jgi:glucan-binding YG repeat protein
MMKANKKVMAALLAAMMTVSAGAAVVSAGNVSGPGAEIPNVDNNSNGWNGEVITLDNGTKVNGYYYQTAKNEYAKGWKLIDGKWYYFAKKSDLSASTISHNTQNGNGTDKYKYYAVMDKKVDIDYNDDDRSPYTFRFGKDGAMITGWYQTSNAVDPIYGDARNWEYYSPSTGAQQTGWIKVGANWFYMTDRDNFEVTYKENGHMMTKKMPKGTLLMGGTYTFKDSEKASEKTYTFADNGVLVNEGQGWVKEGGDWYYVQENGTRAHATENGTVDGWKLINGKYYYFLKNGKMLTGWANIYTDDTMSKTAWYYMTSNGDCVLNNWIQMADGTWYLTNPSGEMVTGWAVRGGKTYYLNEGFAQYGSYGAMVTGTVVIQNNTYTFDASGALVSVNNQPVNPGTIPQFPTK